MLKKLLLLAVVSSSLIACASWFTKDQSAPNNPNVGSKDSSDFLFGQATSAPAKSTAKKAGQPIASSPATNASSAI